MTPDKQKLYDTFLAGMAAAYDEVNLGNPIIGYSSRSRFEEWLDERDTVTLQERKAQIVSDIKCSLEMYTEGEP